MIGVIDYHAGNSPSVINALVKIGAACCLVKTADELRGCSGIILPGVGSADATMDSIKELGIRDALERLVLGQKRPFLGICVGLQVLFEHSEEGDVDCLGWLKGSVRRFDGGAVRVPQMGWNRVDFTKESVLTRGERSGYFYFVNSYRAVPTDKSDILGQADYGGDFCAFAQRGNIFASQCHLEKSGSAGLRLLKNFVDHANANLESGRTEQCLQNG